MCSIRIQRAPALLLRLLRGISSKWVALVAMGLLLLFSLVGVLVPQESLLAPVSLEAWQVVHPRWTALLKPWGGFKVFYAPVFMLSQVPSMVEFGLLMVVCVTTSFLASITLLPALVILAKPRFLGIRPLTSKKEHRVAA